MTKRRLAIATAVGAACAVLPAAAQAHVSFHPNAIPQGSYVTTYVRVPNEVDHANITSVAIKLPNGVLSALGDPPPGWTFKARTKKLAKPIKTDDGVVTTEVTQVDFTGGDTPPGEFANLPLTLSFPDSAKAGSVLSFPTVQTYSNGEVVRWIDPSAADEHPAPTVDITAPGTADLDVTGGDAGPPAKLPADLAGPTSGSAAASAPASVTHTVVKKETSTLSVIALIVGVLGFIAGAAALLSRRNASA
jgi:periplasmic copper chaperone A